MDFLLHCCLLVDHSILELDSGEFDGAMKSSGYAEAFDLWILVVLAELD